MESSILFKLINELIVSIAQFLWPIVTLVIILVFRRDIAALLGRIRRGKLFGQEVELDPAINKFRTTVQEAQDEIPYSPLNAEEFERETEAARTSSDAVFRRAPAVRHQHLRRGALQEAAPVRARHEKQSQRACALQGQPHLARDGQSGVGGIVSPVQQGR